MRKLNSFITAREIVRKYPLSYQTLNYYTTIGLLSVVKKSTNQRLYREPDIRDRLRKITSLKNEGYPLHLIRRLLTSENGKELP